MDEFREVQLVELELMLEVDRICRQEDIQYSLFGGTLLGAVRHKGFIPWDNDADIIMQISEYEKFCKACEGELDSEKYFFQNYQTDKHYRWGFAKLCRNNSTFIRKGQENMEWKQAINIDIFIADRVPDNWLRRRVFKFKCFCMRKGLYSVVGVKIEKNILLKVVYLMMSKFPKELWLQGFEKSQRRIKQNTEKFHQRGMPTYNTKDARYGLSSSVWNKLTEYEFEGHLFYGFDDYQTYLEEAYGDWQTLPPENKREGLQASKIVLPDEV